MTHQLFQTLTNQIRISDRTKFELKSNRIKIQLPEYSIIVRICFEFKSILGAFLIRIRFAKSKIEIIVVFK
jgi:hypothetical protein